MTTEIPAQARPVDALLVIDMQNSFCHPDGIMYAALGPPLFEIEATVKATAAAVAAARAAQVPVVFTRHQYQPGHVDFGRLFPQFRDLLAATQKLLSVLQSQVTTRATSSGWPGRPIGMRPRR